MWIIKHTNVWVHSTQSETVLNDHSQLTKAIKYLKQSCPVVNVNTGAPERHQEGGREGWKYDSPVRKSIISIY